MTGGSERWEYLRQPHIVVLGVACIAVTVGVVFSLLRGMDKMQMQQTQGTEQSCLEFIEDGDLCRFIAASETDGFSDYVSVSTETNDNFFEITTLEVEDPNRMRSVTTDGINEKRSHVLIGANTYAKDYSDGMWGVFFDTEYVADQGGIVYDMTSDSSTDVALFRDNYKREAIEPCGELTCFRYSISDPQFPDAKTYIWFDDERYLMQRYQSQNGSSVINIQYTYKPVTVSAPEPLKKVSEDEIIKLLEQ